MQRTRHTLLPAICWERFSLQPQPWFWSQQYDLLLQCRFPAIALESQFGPHATTIFKSFSICPTMAPCGVSSLGRGTSAAKDMRLGQILMEKQAKPTAIELSETGPQKYSYHLQFIEAYKHMKRIYIAIWDGSMRSRVCIECNDPRVRRVSSSSVRLLQVLSLACLWGGGKIAFQPSIGIFSTTPGVSYPTFRRQLGVTQSAYILCLRETSKTK